MSDWWPVLVVGVLILAALVYSIWTEHRHMRPTDDEREP